jgi:hypothetical protein
MENEEKNLAGVTIGGERDKWDSGTPVVERLKRPDEEVVAQHSKEVCRKFKPKRKPITPAFPLYNRVRPKDTKPGKVKHMVELEGKMLEKVANPQDLTTAEAVFEAFRLFKANHRLSAKEITAVSGKKQGSVSGVLSTLVNVGVISFNKAGHKQYSYWLLQEVLGSGRAAFVQRYNEAQREIARKKRRSAAVKDVEAKAKKAKKAAKVEKAAPPDETSLHDRRRGYANKIQTLCERLNVALESAHLAGLTVNLGVEGGPPIKLEPRVYLEF